MLCTPALKLEISGSTVLLGVGALNRPPHILKHINWICTTPGFTARRWLMRCKMTSFFCRQEKHHNRTVQEWQLPWRKPFWGAAVFIDTAKHPVFFHSNPHGGTCSIHTMSSICGGSFIYNTGFSTLEVVWQRLIIIICQPVLQTQRRNSH